jgi:glucose/arabinose dehydrogenase
MGAARFLRGARSALRSRTSTKEEGRRYGRQVDPLSFDRQTGALIVGDVGQGTREEINVVTRGGNYGWRVLEGTFCTGLGPAACTAPGFFPPVTEYAPHVGGAAR